MTRLSLLLVLLLAAPLASAQGFWDPPGEDPCDMPIVECFGNNSPSTALMDGMTGAADAAGKDMIGDKDSNDPAVLFILWMADTFGPNIPGADAPPAGDAPPPREDTPPGEDPPPGEDTPPSDAPPPGEGGDEPCSGDDCPEAESFPGAPVGDSESIDEFRRFLDEYKEGSELRMDGLRIEARLLEKREVNQRDRSEYRAIILIGEGRRAIPVFVYANGKRLYAFTPKKRR